MGEENTNIKRPQRPINLEYRDECITLLEELNYCREENWYLPWKCNEERHKYEKCQYEAFKKRMKTMEKLN
ncbi:hypothetical protein PCANB_001647 [Pneumocystis canis]|nr:hypothetical protein PCANB_001647 [Pneumocystis canis]